MKTSSPDTNLKFIISSVKSVLPEDILPLLKDVRAFRYALSKSDKKLWWRSSSL